MDLDNEEQQREHFEQSAPIQSEESPFWPRNLIAIFLRPREFFSSQLALGHRPNFLLVAWCYGISGSIDRIDSMIMRAELGRPRAGWETMGPLLTESWVNYWAAILVFGAIGGLTLWWIGGWWYRVRLDWSGGLDADSRKARLVYMYSGFVYAGPAVLLALIQTVLHPDYASAFAADDPWVMLLLIFPFWSCYTSYCGATTVFELNRRKARIWFLVLPILMYFAAFGVLAVLFALLTELRAFHR